MFSFVEVRMFRSTIGIHYNSLPSDPPRRQNAKRLVNRPDWTSHVYVTISELRSAMFNCPINSPIRELCARRVNKSSQRVPRSERAIKRWFARDPRFDNLQMVKVESLRNAPEQLDVTHRIDFKHLLTYDNHARMWPRRLSVNIRAESHTKVRKFRNVREGRFLVCRPHLFVDERHGSLAKQAVANLSVQ